MEDDTPSRWQPKESGYNHTHIRQNRLPAKRSNKRQRWTVYNDKEDIAKKDITVINIYAHTIGAPKYIK